MPASDELVVAIARDWERCKRGVIWRHCLKELPGLRTTVCEYGLADEPGLLALGSEEKLFVEQIRESQILVINWDAANGDPDFGADFAQRWFQHRRPDLLSWVDKGGILVIEGQATLGVPTQAAYDAILDYGEVFVCGPEDPLRPELQRRRYGFACRLTRRAQKSELFRPLAYGDFDSRDTTCTFGDMLPKLASRVVTPDLGDLKWNMMYRGWFRWTPLRERRLDWVPLVKTADRRWQSGRFNHTVLIGARHGKGVIFATTMLLASSGQAALIKCLLGAYGRANELPIRSGVFRAVGEFLRKNLVPAVAVVVGAPLVAAATDFEPTGILAGMTQAVLVVIAFFLIRLMSRLLARSWILSKEIRGW